MTAKQPDFTDVSPTGQLAQRLTTWASFQWPDVDQITSLHKMPGNAGLSFGFDIARDAGERTGYVIRFAPPGVRKRGNTDVLRQVLLLEFLTTTDVPVANLVWSTADPAWFGTDAIVQEYLEGSSLGFRDPHWAGHDDFVRDAARTAVGILHRIHSTPATTGIPDWEVQYSVAEEAALWSRLLQKSAIGPTLDQGLRLHDALLDTEPTDHHIGLTHGDFQTNNVLFDLKTGAVSAVVDWELASIGPTGRDLGWLAMMLDTNVWAPEWAATFPVHLNPNIVPEAYQSYSGTPPAHFNWYKAYACFKYGSILGFNHYLHTTGKRPDPIYDELASSQQPLFNAALHLLEK